MRKTYLKKAARFSILTGMVLDTVGFALEDYAHEDQVKWCIGRRDFVPRHLKNTLLNGRGSFNSSMFTLVFKSLAESAPEGAEDVRYAVGDLKEYLSGYLGVVKADRPVLLSRWAAQTQDNDTGLVIPVALAVGYYCAIAEFDSLTFFILLDRVLDVFDLDHQTRITGTAAGFLCFNLLYEGYYCGEALDTLLQYGVVPEALHVFVEHLRDTLFLEDSALIVEALSLPFGYFRESNLAYSQRLLGTVMFYMARVGTGFLKQTLRSLPRDQIMHVMTSPNLVPADAGFLFGMVCTASEQEHPLVIRPLRESVEHRRTLDEALKFL
jgi:hypothetical protein